MNKVELIYISPNAAEKIEDIASVCYNSTPTKELYIFQFCMDSGHRSVAEHSDLTFKITCSRACSHQLVRHRTGKYTQRSQRYCEEDGFKYYIPDTIKKNAYTQAVYDNCIKAINDCYVTLTDMGVPKEDARYVLPNACETVIYITMDFRNFFHFLNERLCTRAQKEIRDIAKEMARLAVEACPVLKRYCVPKCEINKIAYCPEKKSCGRHVTLNELVNKPKKNTKPLIALLGVSGSGKTTVANKLAKKGYVSVKSYTTRPIRIDDENDISSHTFIDPSEVENYRNDIVASATYNDYFYFATRTQLNESDIYIVEKEGLKQLRENYHDKPIIAIYLDVPSEIAAKRMEKRGDSDEKIMERLQCDEQAFIGVKEQCDYILQNTTQENCYDICAFISMIMESYNG